MDNKDYKETLAKQEDLNWDGNTEQQQEEIELEKKDHQEISELRLKKLLNIKHGLFICIEMLGI